MFFRPCFFHSFLGDLFQDLDGFGRFRGPPKSTLALQNDSFYDGASTILNKSCFFIKKSMFKKNMFFYHFWTSKNLPKSVPGPPKAPPGTPLGSQGSPKMPPRPLGPRPGHQNDPSGIDFGCSGPPFWRIQDIFFAQLLEHVRRFIIFFLSDVV